MYLKHFKVDNIKYFNSNQISIFQAFFIIRAKYSSESIEADTSL